MEHAYGALVTSAWTACHSCRDRHFTNDQKKSKAEALLENSLCRHHPCLENEPASTRRPGTLPRLGPSSCRFGHRFREARSLLTDRTILSDRPPVIPKNSLSATRIVISLVTVRVFVSRRYSPKTSAVPARGSDSPSGSLHPAFLGVLCAFLDISCLSCAMIRRKRK